MSMGSFAGLFPLPTVFLLTMLVFMDLALPCLVQRIIDQRIGRHNRGVVLRTELLMFGIFLLASSSFEFNYAKLSLLKKWLTFPGLLLTKATPP
jgi:hypothetical protein